VIQFVEGGLNVISVMEERTAEIQKYWSKPHRLLLLKALRRRECDLDLEPEVAEHDVRSSTTELIHAQRRRLGAWRLVSMLRSALVLPSATSLVGRGSRAPI
jgi:hypothetical protein